MHQQFNMETDVEIFIQIYLNGIITSVGMNWSGPECLQWLKKKVKTSRDKYGNIQEKNMVFFHKWKQEKEVEQ